jgi:actin-related protein 6
MDETHVMNQVKEDSCFVSQNFAQDMDIGRKRDKENTIARDYVLPDFTTLRRGYVRCVDSCDKNETEQVLS